MRVGSQKLKVESRKSEAKKWTAISAPPRLCVMNSEQFRDLLEPIAEGWARRDYAQLARAFAPDFRYGDPTRYVFQNRHSLKSFFEDDEGLEQSTIWHNIVFDEAQQLGAAEYTYDGSHRYHGLVLVRLAEGMVTHWREYQHIDSRPWEQFVAATAFPAASAQAPE
jgi:hypothetical protein